MSKDTDNTDDGSDVEWLEEHDDNEDDTEPLAWYERLPVAPKTLAAGLSAVLVALLSVVMVLYAPFLWTVAYFATIIGFLPGLTLFPWITSPFGPGLLMLSEPFARIHLTISQFIRRIGILVKRESNEYEIGTYLPDRGVAMVSDGLVDIDEERTSWGLFGKRKFGVTAERGTDFYKRIRASNDVAADGGESSGWTVNMAAAHRYFEGANDADVISRTEEKAEAEYGGGDKDLSGMAMGLLIGLMLLMGWLTTYLML